MGIVEFLISPLGQSLIGAVLVALGNVTAKHMPQAIPILGKTNKVMKQAIKVIDIIEMPNRDIKMVAEGAGLKHIAKLIDARK